MIKTQEIDKKEITSIKLTQILSITKNERRVYSEWKICEGQTK